MTLEYLPYFAQNGAILMERRRGRICVSSAFGLPLAMVELEPLPNGELIVDVPGNWLHTEEEYETVCRLAREAVREWLGKDKKEATGG
jgi:hypothetical protein